MRGLLSLLCAFLAVMGIAISSHPAARIGFSMAAIRFGWNAYVQLRRGAL